MPLQPTLFISHGAPNIVLHDSPARRFFDGLAGRLSRPDAIVVASAHYETEGPAVCVSARPRTIHDFYGFEPELYDMQYPAQGDPSLASRIAQLLTKSLGRTVAADENWGLDHGAWNPLSRIYPEADIPVVAVSIAPAADPAYHCALGRALSALREENVLLIGSGSMTHNLKRLMRDAPASAGPPDWVAGFMGWCETQLIAGEEEALLGYREAAPFARDNHPTDEHFLPLFFAMGAAGEGWRAERWHHSLSHGSLVMDTWAFLAASGQ